MTRIAGVNLPKGKRVEVALTYIYGIGRTKSKQILTKCNIGFDIKVDNLSDADENRLRDEIAKHTTEGDLQRKTQLDIKRLQDIGTYRGFRHRRKLPVRGQRTKTNARTKRGKKVTMGSGKNKETKK